MSLLNRARDGLGVRASVARVTGPGRAQTREEHRASRAFSAALGTGYRADRPRPRGTARLAGIEHEFAVLEHGRQLDFRDLIQGLGIPGPQLDPADPFAHRLRSGSVITTDDREAEIAIAPVTVGPGFSAEADRQAADVRDELVRLIGPGRSLAGYSTHLSLSMRDEHLDAAARLYARSFAPGLMLLLDHRDAPGLLVRPRPGRLELGGTYLAGDALRAALVFAAATARAVSRAVADAQAFPLRGHRRLVPPLLAVMPEQATIRYGWFVAGKAFGGDLYATGRSTLLPLANGGSMTAGEHLRRAWDAARPLIEESASAAELALVDAAVEGRLPLPSELPQDRPDCPDPGGLWVRVDTRRSTLSAAPALGDHPRGEAGGQTTDESAADPPRPANPFGAVAQPQERPAYSVRPVVLRWDFSLLQLETREPNPSQAYAVVPASALAEYVTRLDAGSLDRSIEAYLAQAATAGSGPSQPDQVVTPGLYTHPGTVADLLPLERTPGTGEPARTDKSKQGRKLVVPGPRTTPLPEPTPPETTPTPGERHGWFAPAAIVLGCVAIVVVGGGLLLGRGGTAAPSSSPPVSSATAAIPPPSSSPAAQASPTPGPVGLGWTGTTVELTFANLTFGQCASATRAGVPPTFGGGWTMATQPGAGSNVALNMLALPTSPFAPALNGSIAPTGVLQVSGDSAVEAMNLTLDIPSVPAGPLSAPLNVTGSAQVALHTSTGDCHTGWTVSGTLAP
ncbi:MAG: hypothetical protein P4L84_26370, partial [Isosphaeraceae bacterium]|nr:hypothetical protein [Isosphaeraceae bacterium]